MTHDLIDQLSDFRVRGIDAALCMIVKTEGSTPSKAGASMLVRADGTTTGTVGGGALEQAVIAQALGTIADGTSALFTHRLVRDHNMCCGGTVDVFIKPLPVPERLYIFGAGHVGSALSRICERLFTEVTVIDDRATMFDGFASRSVKFINACPHDAMPLLVLDAHAYVVIATYSHPLDREILRYCIRLPLAYCGMIGSARKVAVTRTLFLEQCWATSEQLDRVDMPIGLDISAETPEELAVSIAARLIAIRHNAHGATDRATTLSLPEFDMNTCVAAATPFASLLSTR